MGFFINKLKNKVLLLLLNLVIVCLPDQKRTPIFLNNVLTVHNICFIASLGGLISAFIYNQMLFAKYNKNENEVKWSQAWKFHDAYEKDSEKVIYLATASYMFFLIGVLHKHIFFNKKSSGLTEPLSKSKFESYLEQAAPNAAPTPKPNNPDTTAVEQES